MSEIVYPVGSRMWWLIQINEAQLRGNWRFAAALLALYRRSFGGTP